MERPEVIFHRLAGSKKALDACRLVERLYLEGQRVVVWFQDEGKAAIFDQYLWTFSDTAFVPHRVAKEGEPVEEPVALVIGPLFNPNGATHLVVMELPGSLKQVKGFPVVHDLLPVGEERQEQWEKASFAVREVRGVATGP